MSEPILGRDASISSFILPPSSFFRAQHPVIEIHHLAQADLLAGAFPPLLYPTQQTPPHGGQSFRPTTNRHGVQSQRPPLTRARPYCAARAKRTATPIAPPCSVGQALREAIIRTGSI